MRRFILVLMACVLALQMPAAAQPTYAPEQREQDRLGAKIGAAVADGLRGAVGTVVGHGRVGYCSREFYWAEV